MEKMALQRWLALMARLHLPPSQVTFDELQKAYTASERHYHNDRHIAHCLAELDAATPHIHAPDPIELALWFHDAIYDSHSVSNEADSTRWAVDFLTDCQAEPELKDAVASLILATRHQPIVLAVAQQWMVDIDLSSLGAEPEQWAADDRAIRREYAWVPEVVFRQKRAAILRSFLARPVLYVTDYFHDKYEAQARLNLASAIQRLEK